MRIRVSESCRNTHALPLPRRDGLAPPAAARARSARRPITRQGQGLSREEGLCESPHRAAQRPPAQGRPAAGLAGAGGDRRARAEHAGACRHLAPRSPSSNPTTLPPRPSWRGIYLLGNALDPALKLANKAGELDPEECGREGAQGRRSCSS